MDSVFDFIHARPWPVGYRPAPPPPSRTDPTTAPPTTLLPSSHVNGTVDVNPNGAEAVNPNGTEDASGRDGSERVAADGGQSSSGYAPRQVGHNLTCAVGLSTQCTVHVALSWAHPRTSYLLYPHPVPSSRSLVLSLLLIPLPHPPGLPPPIPEPTSCPIPLRCTGWCGQIPSSLQR